MTYVAERDEVDRTVEARKLVIYSDDSIKFLRLPSSNHIRNHSPAGYGFSYSGSGPAQLSLSILVEALGEELAVQLYQKFKREFVAKAEGDEFRVTASTVREWAERQALSPSSDALDVWGESLGE